MLPWILYFSVVAHQESQCGAGQLQYSVQHINKLCKYRDMDTHCASYQLWGHNDQLVKCNGQGKQFHYEQLNPRSSCEEVQCKGQQLPSIIE